MSWFSHQNRLEISWPQSSVTTWLKTKEEEEAVELEPGAAAPRGRLPSGLQEI